MVNETQDAIMTHRFKTQKRLADRIIKGKTFHIAGQVYSLAQVSERMAVNGAAQAASQKMVKTTDHNELSRCAFELRRVAWLSAYELAGQFVDGFISSQKGLSC